MQLFKFYYIFIGKYNIDILLYNIVYSNIPYSGDWALANTEHDVRCGVIKLNETRKITCPLKVMRNILFKKVSVKLVCSCFQIN